MNATAEPPQAPANLDDSIATLKRKLLTIRSDLSPRLIAVVGDILEDTEWSVPAFEPITVRGDRVHSAGDDAFSIGQIRSTFARAFEKIALTPAERSIWNQKLRCWLEN